ncbi:MAG TPA: hypothetical protein GX699_09320 [Firmicutes bacterium]|nr:hypothetical protein [Bacillota bacterium]
MLEKALSGIKESLSYEGYDLLYREREDGVIDIQILAGPDACEDCLVPKPILENMIRRELDEHGVTYTAINLQTPKD